MAAIFLLLRLTRDGTIETSDANEVQIAMPVLFHAQDRRTESHQLLLPPATRLSLPLLDVFHINQGLVNVNVIRAPIDRASHVALDKSVLAAPHWVELLELAHWASISSSSFSSSSSLMSMISASGGGAFDLQRPGRALGDSSRGRGRDCRDDR